MTGPTFAPVDADTGSLLGRNGTCACGCGERTTVPTQNHSSLGRIKGQPLKWVRGHNGRMTIPDKFWPKFQQTDGCWLWEGAITADGYGTIGHGGRTLFAHRVAYELLIGPIPKGLHIDHLCCVRRCVQPRHLEAVTQAENNRRAVQVRSFRRAAS